MELRTELQTETEKKIQELTEKHSEEMKELKQSDEKFLEDSLEKLKSENEENLRLEKLNHEREMNRLSAAHQDDMDRLTDEKNAIQEELSKIEST
jgi:DNA-binding PadR family transcriptional regulator